MTSADFHGQATAPDDRYRALLAVSEAIVSHRDLSALFHELAGRLQQVVRFDYLALVLHEAASNTMRLHVLETPELTLRPARNRSSCRRRPGGVGVADPATAHHLERGRGQRAGRGCWNECSRMESRAFAGFR